MEDAETPKSAYNGEALQKEGAKWMERIRAAEKREEDWRKAAMAAEKAFTNDPKGDEGKLYDFNILHSNVETIVPAIYNSTPVPDVRRRWIEATEEPKPPQIPEGQQPDPRIIKAFQDEVARYQQQQQFDTDAKAYGDMIERAIVVQIDDNKLDTEIEANAQDAFLAGRGIVRLRLELDEDGEVVRNERLTFEAVSWRDFRMGPAKRWDWVPWIAFRHTAPRETLEAKVIDPEINASYRGLSDAPAISSEKDDDDDIPYWEIWCRETKKVKFVRENDGRVIKMSDDPLGLKDFFPMPRPIQPITLTGKMTPVCPFSIYRKLADELDNITKRINKIMEGLKVRGIIAGQADKLLSLAEAGDNEIRVETDLEALAQTGGLEKAIMWWPIEQAIKVLKELYAQREIVKQSIYEITGISDIVRGASTGGVKSATEQQIKTQWGSLRIQKMQRLIERQVRDMFAIMAELITSKFSEETLHQMTAIEITDGMRQLMQEPILASYRVDVESDSTVRADLTRQKQDMTEFMQGTAQYFATMGPLVEQAPEAAEPVAEIFASMARIFKLGREAEDAIESLKSIAKKAASTPRPNPEAEAVKAEMQMKQADHQMAQQKANLELQLKQKDLELKQAEGAMKLNLERQKADIELEIARVNLAMKQAEASIKAQQGQIGLQTKVAETNLKLDAQRESAAIKSEQAREKQPA